MKQELTCEYCGTIIKEGERYCPNCGANCSESIKKYRIEEEKRRLERIKNHQENNKKIKNRLKGTALIILVIGLTLGGLLIYNGFNPSSQDKLKILEEELKNKQEELKEKGIRYNVFAEYTDGEKYDLKIITEAMDPSFDHCNFDEYKNNPLTKDYCKYKNKSSEEHKYVFLGLGIFIIISTCMISFSVFASSKAGDLMTYQNKIVIKKEKTNEK